MAELMTTDVRTLLDRNPFDVAAVTDCHLPDISSQNNLASPALDIPVTGVPAIPLAIAPVRYSVAPLALRASVSIPEPPPLLRNSVLLI